MRFETEITRIYDSAPEHEWARMDRHRTEFFVTLRTFDDFLPQPPAAILDCGELMEMQNLSCSILLSND